jgi:GDPmannose 4,6-dehydratase
MLQQPIPDDYVVATGETHSIRELCEIAFDYAGLQWKDNVVVDPGLYRPADVDVLQGDASKAKKVLGWSAKVKFSELVAMMVEADLERVKRSTRQQSHDHQFEL